MADRCSCSSPLAVMAWSGRVQYTQRNSFRRCWCHVGMGLDTRRISPSLLATGAFWLARLFVLLYSSVSIARIMLMSKRIGGHRRKARECDGCWYRNARTRRLILRYGISRSNRKRTLYLDFS